ncbi:hypothetical protein ACOMHN_013320 [Nucella lapillus]
MGLWNLQKQQLPAVALLLPTAASDRLPHQSSARTGTVVNREQLRQEMSEDGGLLRDVSGPDEPARTSERGVYTRPHKVRPPQSKGESQARTRQVMFADSPASSEERRVQISRSFVERTAPPQPTNQKAALCRQVSSPVRREESGEGGTMDTHVSLYEDQDGKVKGLVELSTLRQRRVPHIKVRVICLIDVSGSMLHKGDKQQRRSKISILKTMAVDIIDALEDEEDFFGVMTFGEETRVLCPLTRVTSASRAHVKSTVSDLDKSSGFSAVTDLSSALIDAVHMLTTAQQDEGSVRSFDWLGSCWMAGCWCVLDGGVLVRVGWRGVGACWMAGCWCVLDGGVLVRVGWRGAGACWMAGCWCVLDGGVLVRVGWRGAGACWMVGCWCVLDGGVLGRVG